MGRRDATKVCLGLGRWDNCTADATAVWTGGSLLNATQVSALNADRGDMQRLTYLESNDFDLPQRLVILIGLESDEVNGDLEKY